MRTVRIFCVHIDEQTINSDEGKDYLILKVLFNVDGGSQIYYVEMKQVSGSHIDDETCGDTVEFVSYGPISPPTPWDHNLMMEKSSVAYHNTIGKYGRLLHITGRNARIEKCSRYIDEVFEMQV